jgi:hypothetical protein
MYLRNIKTLALDFLSKNLKNLLFFDVHGSPRIPWRWRKVFLRNGDRGWGTYLGDGRGTKEYPSAPTILCPDGIPSLNKCIFFYSCVQKDERKKKYKTTINVIVVKIYYS